MNNTKERSSELAAIAAEILTASGADITDSVSIAPMVETMTARTGCHTDTARRHLARAVRRARGELVKARWGGARDGAGRGHIKPV